MLAAGTNSPQNWKTMGVAMQQKGQESTGLGSWVRTDTSSIVYKPGLLSWLPASQGGQGGLNCGSL